jgi:phosphoribosylformylglycinamidine synthase
LDSERLDKSDIIGMAGIIEDCDQFCTMPFKNEGDLIVLIGENKEEIGGSEYLKLFHNLEKGMPPQIDLTKEKVVQQVCRKAINKEYTFFCP